MRRCLAWVPVVLAAVVAAVVAVACGGSASSPTAPSTPGLSATARTQLDALLNAMEGSSINRRKIDWPAFRQTVEAAARSSVTIADLETNAVPTSLRLLDDHHSFYIRANGSYILNPVPLPSCSESAAAAVSVPTGIGYVKVTAFSGTAVVDFAVSIQDQIRSVDSADLLGWIVDLRGNGGGNMWPMIAGVGPILGDGLAGAFVNPDGYVANWGYAGGGSYNGTTTVVQVPNAYVLRKPNPRVAVLTDCWVASSGEAVTIAFRTRPNTRSFGTATMGASTANSGFRLPDGATLQLTVATMADRTLTPYGSVVVPDEVTGGSAATVARAIAWLGGF